MPLSVIRRLAYSQLRSRRFYFTLAISCKLQIRSWSDGQSLKALLYWLCTNFTVGSTRGHLRLDFTAYSVLLALLTLWQLGKQVGKERHNCQIWQMNPRDLARWLAKNLVSLTPYTYQEIPDWDSVRSIWCVLALWLWQPLSDKCASCRCFADPVPARIGKGFNMLWGKSKKNLDPEGGSRTAGERKAPDAGLTSCFDFIHYLGSGGSGNVGW